MIGTRARKNGYPKPCGSLYCRKCEGGHRGCDVDTAPAISLPVTTHCSENRTRPSWAYSTKKHKSRVIISKSVIVTKIIISIKYLYQMSSRGWRTLQRPVAASVAVLRRHPRSQCLRAFATEAPVDSELKPSNYGQPLFRSHPHLCEPVPRSPVATH